MGAHHENSLTKKDYLILAALFVAALGIRLYFLQFFRVISADGVGYVSAAREIIKGNGFAMATIYGVVYPVLTGLTSLLAPDFELAGRIVSMVMGSLLVVPLYLLGSEFFSRKVGLIACILAIVWPSIRMWSGEVMTQATYMTILLTGVYLVWRAAWAGTLLLSFLAGLVMGLAYITRPEAVIVFVLMTPFVLLYGNKGGVPDKQRFVALAAMFGGFCCCLIPYLVLVHSVTGKWQLAGKSGVTLADALSGYLGRPDMKLEPGFQGIGFVDVLRKYPDFVWDNFLKNSKNTLQTMLPLYMWGLGLLGFISGGWTGEKVVARIFLLVTFAPLLIIVVFFFVGPEYLQPFLPVLFLWVGEGGCRLENGLGRMLGIPWRREGFREHLASPALVLALLLAGWLIIQQLPTGRNIPYHYEQDGGRYDHKRIGLLLKKHLPADSIIMSRWGRISFYAEMQRVDIPQAGFAEILRTASEKKVRYIIVDGMLLGVRPQLGGLLQPLLSGEKTIYYVARGEEGYRPLPKLRLCLLYKEPSSLGVAVYELIN